MTLSALLPFLVQVIVVVALVAVLGRWLTRILKQEQTWGAVEVGIAGIGGFVAGAVALMLVHIVTGGWVFGPSWPVPLAGIIVVVAGLRRGIPRPSFEIRSVLAVALFLVVLSAIFITPMIAGGSSMRTGDPPWHLGWTEQLLGGEPLPTGPAPEFARNAYPWGHHALLATMTRSVPGASVASSHDALHVLLVGALPLVAAALARAVDRRAGWPAAIAMSLVGGWGFLQADGPQFDPSPSRARFGADLVVASPNSLYELFPPALPREVGLVLLGVFGALLLRSIGGPRQLRWAAGVVAGVVGLVSVPMALNALLWLVLVVAVVRGPRLELLRDVGLPAAAVFATWAFPLMVTAVVQGGFVGVSPQLGREWPLHVSLSSWGLLLPAAVIGIVLLARRAGNAARSVLAIAVGSSLLLLLALARDAFDWAIAGQATLLHQGRTWPALHLIAAAAAGTAVAALGPRLVERSRSLAVAATVVVAALGVASPVVASRGLKEIMSEHRAGFVYGAPDLQPGAFVRRAADHIDSEDIVLVEGSDELAFLLFQFSGARLAEYDDARLEENDLRIRFRDLARRYEERANGDGFVPDWLVVRTAKDLGSAGRRPPRPVLSGAFDSDEWTLYRLSDPSGTT
ncbi:MAG: hypothetical protein ACR2KQ_01555 [Actinomycetota bacterium]